MVFVHKSEESVLLNEALPGSWSDACKGETSL